MPTNKNPLLLICVVTLLALFLPPAVAASEGSFFSQLGSKLGLGSDEEEILDPDQAFVLSTQIEDGQLKVYWNIADGHYLYREKTQITLENGNSVQTGELWLPDGKLVNDEFFGEIQTYYNQAEASLPIQNLDNEVKKANFNIRYQGCSEISGICYPPITKRISVELPAGGSVAAPTVSPTPTPPTVASNNPAEEMRVSEQDRIADSLKSGNTMVTILSFFGFGLLLAFTPCVFPMIPILSGIIAGHGENITTRRAFSMSVVYVLAMAVTYTIAGVMAGLFGENLQAAFQNPWILGGFVVVFVLLALSMFGFYDLQMPTSIQSRLSELSNRQKGGTLAGVAVMGFLSALIVGPCVAAPLAGALIYIGQTGDALLGGMALFALSLGMGAPLIAIGTSAGKLLPRAGAWMNAIKAVFGVLLLAVAIWMLERIVPAALTMALWAALLIVSAVYMGALDSLSPGGSGWRRLWKGLGLIMLSYGVLLLIGVSAGGRDVLQPLKGVSLAGASVSAENPRELQFTKIKGLEELNLALAQAKKQGKPVMLDFYADWCVSCKEMEKYTFSDAEVQKALSNALLLKADVTPNDELDKQLYKHFGIFGPPAIIFYDVQGVEQRGYRVVGFVPPEKFSEHVNKAIGGI